MYRKNVVYTGFGAIRGFRHPLGPWNIGPVDKEGLLYILSKMYLFIHMELES